MIANEEPALVLRSVEGLHQMRVALRRLSSAFALFKHITTDGEARGILTEAKWLATQLGAARDLDVFLVALQRSNGKSGAGPAANLRRAATKARTEAWKAALTAIRSQRYTRFVLRLARYIAGHGWKHSAHERSPELDLALHRFSEHALDKAYRKVCELGSEITKLEIEDRHQLRKRLKKLRYSLSFFSSLYRDAEVKRYLHELSSLQDIFGSLNDAAVGHEILDRLCATDPSLKRSAATLSGKLDRRAAKDWREAQHSWAKFDDHQKPFWR
jgi:CHAD domain-containing protein